MRRAILFVLVAIVAAAGGAAGGWWLADRRVPDASDHAAVTTSKERVVLYYKDPSGLPDYSATPKKDAAGRDFVAIYEDEEPGLAPAHAPAQPQDRGRILYYRNPMGLPDTSPVPKKDSMGMNYVPVYENEAGDEEGIVRVSPQRVQMLGVRSEVVEARDLVRPIRAAGTIAFDERRSFVVTTKAEGWIEQLIVNATGETVRRGQPLMRIYSPDLFLAQQEYAALREAVADSASSDDASARLLDGALRRLRALDAPEDVVQSLQRGGAPQRTVTLRSPYNGTVVAKPAVEGMRFMPGEPLYRIVDLASVWLIADVFEQDMANIAVGEQAQASLKAYPDRRFTGRVAFVYPSLGGETRTARVRIELANPGGLMKENMYAEVEIAAPVGRRAPAVPDSAVIDSGARQVVLIDRGDGRFEPRPVRLGVRAEGFVEVLDGVREGERVVTAANFLIDAESNLRAALQAFTPPPATPESGTPQSRGGNGR